MDSPLPASRFLVEVDDRPLPLSEVRGLTYDPDLKPPATVVLRRAAGRDPALLDWARKPAPRSVRVTVLGPGGDAAVSYQLRGARPVAWHGPELDATSPQLAMEELVLAVDAVDLR